MDKKMTMNTTQLKKNLTAAISTSKDKEFLEVTYALLKSRDGTNNGTIWNSLSDREKHLLDHSIDQVADPDKVYNARDIVKE